MTHELEGSIGARQSVVVDLARRALIAPPQAVLDHVHYETQVGSVAYGVARPGSDVDIYGFFVPPKAMVFSHLEGHIPGFDEPRERLEHYQRHGVVDGAQIWDLTFYSIVRFFRLCLENSPNVIETLYTPQSCVRACSPVAARVRARRALFLHRGAWPKFRGFALSQLQKLKTESSTRGARAERIACHGFDVKIAYHAVRLLDEAEQLLVCGELDLQRARETLKAVRRGEWSLARVEAHLEKKIVELDALCEQSPLPKAPRHEAARELLLECLEQSWGDLDGLFGSAHSR